MSNALRGCFLLGLSMALLASTGCRDDPDAALPPAPAVDSSAKPPVEPAPRPEPGVAVPSGPAAPQEPGSGAPEEPAADSRPNAAEIEAALASLSAEDRALALEQKICPVSSEPLGTMGTPIKVAVAGHEVFICCDHCQESLLADPAKHLATLGKQPAVTAAE